MKRGREDSDREGIGFTLGSLSKHCQAKARTSFSRAVRSLLSPMMVADSVDEASCSRCVVRKARVGRLLCVAMVEVSWKSDRERSSKEELQAAFMPA